MYAAVMVKSRRTASGELSFQVASRRSIPYPFVLDALSDANPTTGPLFSCVAVYVRGKIVFALREKPSATADNGVWLATTAQHHESLRREFPNMRSIGLLGKPITAWQLLAADAPDFEKAALRACEMVVAGDPRIGKTSKRSA
jgi:hypothetical protein